MTSPRGKAVYWSNHADTTSLSSGNRRASLPHGSPCLDWFGQQRMRPEALEALKFDLLKSTYRLTRESHPTLYAAADEVAMEMNVRDPITLYQSQSDTAPNAQVIAAASEVHLVQTVALIRCSPKWN